MKKRKEGRLREPSTWLRCLEGAERRACLRSPRKKGVRPRGSIRVGMDRETENGRETRGDGLLAGEKWRGVKKGKFSGKSPSFCSAALPGRTASRVRRDETARDPACR